MKWKALIVIRSITVNSVSVSRAYLVCGNEVMTLLEDAEVRRDVTI